MGWNDWSYIKRGVIIGLIIGIILSIFIGISMYLSLQKGYGDLYRLICSVILIIFPPIILGYLIGLIVNKETRRIGRYSIIFGIISLIILIIYNTLICFNNSCSNPKDISNILISFGAILFLDDFAEGLWIISWYFILGAIIGYLYGKFKNKNKGVKNKK